MPEVIVDKDATLKVLEFRSYCPICNRNVEDYWTHLDDSTHIENAQKIKAKRASGGNHDG